ncbi:hypothetical protein T492DRAFT_974955 [Pavlovales sp. CCMP2436]|nr:hypothetical protein T492DRAFT_974955 [Pavlovales sp. CCMP2436]
MLVRELDLVIDSLKVRSAEQLNLTDADFEVMRARGAMLLSGLGGEINASYANVSATIAERISVQMAEERVGALNTYNQKTAALRREMQQGQAQVRESLARVAELETQVGASGDSSGLGRRATTSLASVAILLGVYNGGVSLWRGLSFEGAPQADVINGSIDLLGAAIAAIALWKIAAKERG